MRKIEDRLVDKSMGYFDAVEKIITRHRYELGETREDVLVSMSTPFAQSVFAMLWPEGTK